MENFNPIVTIICSCYNHQEYVVSTLESVMNQSYSNVELIVVDDGSFDNSVEVIDDWLKVHPQVKFVQNAKNLGLTKSFNNAMKFANGVYYMDLAADDILLPNCVEELVKVHQENPELGIAFSNAQMIDENGNIERVYFDEHRLSLINNAINDNDYYRSLLRESNVICSVSAMYRISLFKEMNGYDENLYFEDLDFWLRVSKLYKVVFVNKVLVQKRFLENSLENAFFVKSNHTKRLHTSFYVVLKKAYQINTTRQEYLALIPRIYKQSRWAIKTLNVKYIVLYFLFFLKTIFKILFSKKKHF